MRIAINCRSFLKRQHTGIGRYTYHLVKGLSEIDRDNEYSLYARKGFFNFKKTLPRFDAKNFRTHIDRFNCGPGKSLKGVDIYHVPSPGSLSAPSGAKIVVTVHDVIFKAYPQGHTPQTIEVGESQFKDIQDKATKIICCSENTAADLKKYYRVPDSRIAVVYQGVDKELFYRMAPCEERVIDVVLSKRNVGSPYILSVGTVEPRKNLINSIKAFHLLKTEKQFLGKLVVIGMSGWMSPDTGSLIKRLGLASSVIFLGHVPDAELRCFYNKAEVFIFPSLYEGFGFPIVEAFACGAPVVTSNVSSCPEIAGDAALTVDPNRPEAIAQAIGKILVDRSLREAMREKGYRRSAVFDFHRTAQETLAVYEEVCCRD